MKKFGLKNIGICCFLFFVISILKAETKYRFNYLNSSDGLTSDLVSAIAQDSYGYLWIGTASGLNRYDGYRIRPYIKSTNSESSNFLDNISDIREDGQRNIWLRLWNNYNIYLRNQNSVTSNDKGYLKKLGITVTDAYFVHIDCEHNLWVFADQILYFYDFAKKQLKQYSTYISMPYGDKALASCASDNQQSLFVVDRDNRFWRIEKNSGYAYAVKLPENCHPSQTGELAVYADEYKNIWIWSNIKEQLYLQPKGSPWKEIPLSGSPNFNSNIVRQVVSDKHFNVWIATDHEGTFVYHIPTRTLENIRKDDTNQHSLASNNVSSLCVDQSGVVWMGHNKNGLSFYNSIFSKFQLQGQLCGDISTLHIDKSGILWIGTDGNGLFYRDQEKIERVNSIPKTVISDIIEGADGTLWIGTFNDGLYAVRKDRVTHYNKGNSRLPTNAAWRLIEDEKGCIWYSSGNSPLVKFNPATKKSNIIKNNDGKDVFGLSMYYDSDKTLYVGTSYGLYWQNTRTGNQGMLFGNGNQLFSDQMILYIYKDNRGILWLGHLHGLTAWDRQENCIYEVTREKDRLVNNCIRSIIEDNNGFLWLSTSNGLSRIKIIRKKDKSLSFLLSNYTNDDGCENTYFNSNSAAGSKDGTIYLGGTRGITTFNPSEIHDEAEFPAIHFSDITAGGRKIISDQNKICIHYNDFPLTISFFTGELSNASKIYYAYRLDGAAGKWENIFNNEISTLTLAPGSYKLYVKACGADGRWGSEQILEITVMPPFYRTWYMLLVYVLTAGLIVYLLFCRYQRREKEKAEQEKQRLVQEHQVNLAEMKLKFFTNVSHDLRTPLTLIVSPLQTLLRERLPESVMKRLEVMQKNVDVLLNQINVLLDFRRLDKGIDTLSLSFDDFAGFLRNESGSFCAYANDRQINLTFTSAEDRIDAKFDKEKVHKIIYNLLSNAFKFTPNGGSIHVSVEQEADCVLVHVADTGKGVDDKDKPHLFERFFQSKDNGEKTGSGIGLHIVGEYVKMHGGNVGVVDNQPCGSIFSFSLPILCDAAPAIRNSESIEIQPAENGRYCILVVDDNKDLCTFIHDSLLDNYQVLIAQDGLEALDILHKENVNLVISDVMMPRMDGLDLCKSIKTDIQLSHIPVILLTAKTAETSMLEGLHLGADDYLTKPFNIELLHLRIQKFIEWTERAHQTFRQNIDITPCEITITSLDEQLIQKCMSLVEEHLDDPGFSVETLGREVGMSRTNLYRKLMNITGRGPADFIRIIRMKHGKQLLDESGLQITEIAYRVGYNSLKRFSDNFKQEYGVTPSEYKRSK